MVGFEVFLQRFTRFLFFLPLLNLGKVGVFELSLCLLWCVCAFGEEIYTKICIEHGK